MNLKTSLPRGVSEQDVCFSLPFDIEYGGGQVDGHCTADHEFIRLYRNNRLCEELDISSFAAFEIQQQVGCSMLRAKDKEGGWRLICAFSQTYFLRYAELSKILDFYVMTGKFAEASDACEPTCPKCGASLETASSCPFCSRRSGTVKKLLQRLAPYKKNLAVSLVLTAVVYVCDIFTPYFQRVIVDEIVTPQTKNWELFGVISACIVSIAVIIAVLDYIVRRINLKVNVRFIRDLRQEVFNKTQELSMKSISRRTPGELIKRVSEDSRTVQRFVTDYGKDMLIHSIALVALVVIMFVTNWRLALLVVIPLPFAFLIEKKVSKMLFERDGRWWRKTCTQSKLLHDILSGIRVVKAYGSEDREIERYNKSSADVSKYQKDIDSFWYIVSPLMRYVISLGEFAMLYFGGSMVLGGEIGLGELIQFTSYVYMLYGPLQWLVNLPRVLSQAMVAAGKIFEILDETTEITDRENALDAPIKGDIAFDHVFFGYKAYNPVLKDITCQIKAGEMIGIVGHSGVGKSTFINLLMRLYDPTSGKITIDGVDIRDMSHTALHSQVGVVLQETFLFSGSVLENIAYAKPDATFEEIIQAAKIANCHDFIVRLPDGYNTLVGEKGYSLSGGERQRIAIARAILHDPKVIILDEATASLDTQTEKQIQEALGRLTKGRTVIAIAHRLSTLSSADRLIVLDKGRLAEMGTHRELMEKGEGGVYYGLVMAQRQTARLKNKSVG